MKASVERQITGRTISGQRLEKRIEEGEIIRLALKGKVISVREGELTFISRTRISEKRIQTQTFHLHGIWYLTKANQLRFKTSLSGKVLRFEGAWRINRNQELVYQWEGRKLKRGYAQFQQLIFRGRWDIDSRLRLKYRLALSDNFFEFEGKIQRLKRIGNRASIYYELGAAYRGKISDSKNSTLVLHGFWRPVSKTEIAFEIKIKGSRPYQIRLKGAYRLTSKSSVEFQLTQPLPRSRPELSIIFSREFMDRRGEWFLKGETDFHKNHFVGAGARVKW